MQSGSSARTLCFHSPRQHERFSRAWFHTARITEQAARSGAYAEREQRGTLCFHSPRQHERFSRAWFHTARVTEQSSAEAARMQSGSSARTLCFHSPRQHERFSRAWFHTARITEQRQRRSGAYAEREQRAHIVLSLAASARALQ